MTDESVIQWTFFNAIEHDNLTKAMSVIDSVVSKGNRLPPQLLIDASRAGNCQFMTLLLDAGAEIDAVNDMGCTACHAAIRGSQFNALKLLTERGANLNVHDGSLLTAVAQSGRRDYRVIIFLLDAGVTLDNLNVSSLFDLVALPQSVTVLKRLLGRNIDLSAMRDVCGRSLCHYVVVNAKDDSDIMAILRAVVLVARVDVNAANHAGRTPLHTAAIKCNVAAMRALCELGADVNRADNDGRPPLLFVAGRWDRALSDGQVAETLLSLGADIDLADKSGCTACHLAAVGPGWLLTACRAAGANLDQLNKAGKSSRQLILQHYGRQGHPSNEPIEVVRQRIAIQFVRRRARHVCVGLQSLSLDALQLCEILMHSCGVYGSIFAFHQWWAIATTVKHFHDRKMSILQAHLNDNE